MIAVAPSNDLDLYRIRQEGHGLYNPGTNLNLVNCSYVTRSGVVKPRLISEARMEAWRSIWSQ